jgi:membrane-associated phospholipid phosphatase
MLGRRSTARFALFSLLVLVGAPAHSQDKPKRLSNWLLEQPPMANPYPTGLSWRVPGEEPSQQLLRHELLENLAAVPSLRAVQDWIRSLPVTGRAPVTNSDARWLIVHPNRDPVLAPGHTVVLPQRPQTVTVISEHGDQCAVRHASGREAIEYVGACSPQRARLVDWVWMAQPDGRVERYGVAPWNREAQDEPAPGAWIWAPSRDQRVSERLSDRLIRFLATQGPAPDPAGGAIDLAPSASSAFSMRARSAAISANDWGEIGLLQTPTARMAPASTLSGQLGHVWPYTRGNVFMQPFDWLEAGFRYSEIANQPYATAGGGQTFKDKGFDAKFRIWRESKHAPELAVGFRDIVGTGLFSSEYVAGSKRYGSLDVSVGMAWGYMAGHVREQKVGEGGTFDLGRYFRGGPGLFGGVQYQTPWQPLLLKAELDPNDYQHEPFANNQPRRTPWNFGLTYRAARGLDLSAGIERGNRLMIGLAFYSKLDEAYAPKLSDPPRVPYALRPPKGPNWNTTSQEIARQTGWRVGSIEQAGRDLRVTLVDPEATYWGERVDRVAAVLNRDAPPEIDRFSLVYRRGGVELAEHVVDRDAWAAEQTRPMPPYERLEAVIARPPEPPPAGSKVFEQRRPRFENSFGGDLIYTLGGGNAFVLYQISAVERARLWIRDDTWIRGKLRLRLIDNYDRFQIRGVSDLPHVRTDVREYLTTSRFTLPVLQMTHIGRITDKQYYSVYAGYLEEMFGGVGTEWLYRPFGGKSAVGVDINYVRQRDFEQDLGFRDYRVATGHATLYYDTGWNDVLATISAGRYLARDVGATFQLSRVFRNGVAVGAYVTKTNVSAAQFGEGSFDKGLFVSIPFDALLTRSTGSVAYLLYQPLTRDGGAKLARADSLYNITSVRDERTLWYKPAAKPEDFSIMPAGPAPYLRAPARANGELWTSNARYRHELVEALYGQGFRNVRADYDSGRLSLKLTNAEIRPAERAIGYAARTALRHAPLEAREIRVVFLDGESPVAIYEFMDLARLERFFSGQIDKAELADHVAVYYADASARPPDPLRLLNDLKTGVEPRTLPQVVRDTAPVKAVERAATDSAAAVREAVHTNWLQAGAVAASVVLASSALDRRVFDSAQNHASNRWVKGAISVGDAIPLLALGGAGLLALDGSNPVRQRTAFAAGEAGATAFVAATGLKYALGRSRPETGEGSHSFHGFNTDDRHNSFPSRHAAVAWAVATPFAAEYGSYWPYAAAAITTLGRAASREHWLSDSIGGSVLGYGLGRVFWQSAQARHKDAPRLMLSTQGVAFRWDLQ